MLPFFSPGLGKAECVIPENAWEKLFSFGFFKKCVSLLHGIRPRKDRMSTRYSPKLPAWQFTKVINHPKT
jgi:hypothetical protein